MTLPDRHFSTTEKLTSAKTNEGAKCRMAVISVIVKKKWRISRESRPHFKQYNVDAFVNTNMRLLILI